ncbi:MAG TPA: GNAT family N-acetyltransferase [Bacillota bacterium]|nr:GNAT family N-acetyltransferase [Bacillota bacterium]
MEMRIAKKEDLLQLKEIWKLCFGDEESFIDFYFQSRDWLREMAVMSLDGRIVSMLTMIPVVLTDRNGKKFQASMLYAIATHPDFQKRGFAERLIEYSNEYLLSKDIFATLLVPAGENLFRFYEKRGYRDGFFVREAVLSRGEIERLTEPTAGEAFPSDPAASCRIEPAEAARYGQIRSEQLKKRPYLEYREEEIAFEKQLALTSGAGLFAIEAGSCEDGFENSCEGGFEGCAYAERISEREVIVKELLISDLYLAAALKQLAKLLPAEKYFVRTPSYAGESLGGTVRPFGMLRINGSGHGLSDAVSYPADSDSWLGIAYD